MTVITVNSSLTQCTVGVVQYHVNAQQSILLHTVTYQNNKPIQHLTHFPTTNNNCTTFICTKEHWKAILTAYCLQSADSQHSHCCCWPTNTLTAVHYTNSTTFVTISWAQALGAAVALNTWYQQNILLLFRQVTECLSYCCFNALSERGINTVLHTVTLLLFLLSPNATDLPASAIHQNNKYVVSLSTDKFHFVRP